MVTVYNASVTTQFFPAQKSALPVREAAYSADITQSGPDYDISGNVRLLIADTKSYQNILKTGLSTAAAFAAAMALKVESEKGSASLAFNYPLAYYTVSLSGTKNSGVYVSAISQKIEALRQSDIGEFAFSPDTFASLMDFLFSKYGNAFVGELNNPAVVGHLAKILNPANFKANNAIENWFSVNVSSQAFRETQQQISEISQEKTKLVAQVNDLKGRLIALNQSTELTLNKPGILASNEYKFIEQQSEGQKALASSAGNLQTQVEAMVAEINNINQELKSQRNLEANQAVQQLGTFAAALESYSPLEAIKV